jgi:hypothetical protein
MLVVHVEIWPGGNMRGRHVIHTLNIVNESQLEEVSDYSFRVDGGEELWVLGHRRDDGALELIRRAIETFQKDDSQLPAP